MRHTDVLQQKFDQENQSEDAFRVRYTRTYDGQLVIHKARDDPGTLASKNAMGG